MGHGCHSWLFVVGGHGSMVAVVTEDGGGRSGCGTMVAIVTRGEGAVWRGYGR